MQQLDPTTPSCLTDLEIDEWLAGQLSPSALQRCQAHASECNTCRARKLALEQSNHAFYAAAPDFQALASQLQQRRSGAAATGVAPVTSGATHAARARGRWRWLAPPLLAACAAVGFIALQPAERLPLAGDTRSQGFIANKGTPQLGFFVKRGEGVTRGDPGTAVFPGDALRFVYSVDRPYYLAIYSADARGVSVYFPDNQLAYQLPVGQETALDVSVELDDTIGRERLIGLFCPEPFAVERVQSALAATSASTAAASLPDTLAGCQHVELELNKKSRP